jgi:glycosyltransferase involved in cell wall biosynthesis
MVPVKGAHIAVQVAQRTGIPLKMAGQIQPMFQEYWDTQVKPHIDGGLIEYVGEADHATKNDLLGNSMACLFPIQWNEPFGLVMVEAMACGTPVLAFAGGAVEEVVRNGISGWVCADVADMAAKAIAPAISPRVCRGDAEQRFSVQRMVTEYESVYFDAVRTNERSARPSGRECDGGAVQDSRAV